MTSLYTLVKEYQDAWCMMEELDELDELSISDTLEGLELPIKDKIINTASYIKNIESDIQQIKNAEQELSLRRSKLERKVNALENYLKNCMKHLDISEVKSRLFDVKIRINPSSVNITDKSLLEERFFKVTESKSVDKISIKKHLKSGEEVPGAELIRTE